MANNGIIDQIVTPDAIASLEKLKKELAENSASMTALLQTTREIVVELQKVGSIKEITAVLEKQKKATQELNLIEKERERIYRATDTAMARRVAQSSTAAKLLEAQRRALAEETRELRNSVTANHTASGSIAQMRAQLNLARQAYDNMSKTMRESPAGKQARDEIKKLSDELKKLEHQTGRDQSNVGNYFGAVKKGLLGIAGALGVTTGIKALIGVFKSGYKTIVDFQAANAKLASILQTSLDGVAKLTEDAKRLGAATEYTASQVTSLQTALASLGFNEGQILDMTESILKFSTAVGADLGEAAKMAGSVLRQFGLDSSQIENTVATMAVGTARSALSFNFLETAMQKVGPVAAKFGFTVEDTTALLGTLANVGMDASTAGTATRNILLNMANASGKLAKELGRPIKTLDDFVDGLKTLDENNVSLAEALELTDKRSVVAFQSFIKGAESLRELRDSVTDVSANLDQMHKTRLNTVEGATKLLSSAWEGLILAFSNSTGIFKLVIDALSAFVNLLHRLVDWIGRNSTAIGVAIAAYVAYKIAVNRAAIATAAHTAAVKINLVLMKTGRSIMMLFAAAMSLMTGNIKGATYAWKIFSKSIIVSPVGMIAAALAGAVVLFSSFTSKAREAAKATEAVGKVIGKFQNDVALERSEIDKLFDSLKKTNQGTAERSRLISQINERYGQYLKNQLSEASTLQEIELAQKGVTKAIIENMSIKAQQDALTPLIDDLSNKMSRLGEKTNKFLKSWQGTALIGRYNAEIDKIRKDALKWADSEFNAKLSDRMLDAARVLGITDRNRANELFKYVKDVALADRLLQKETKNIEKTIREYTDALAGDAGSKEGKNAAPETKNLQSEIINIRKSIIDTEEQLAKLRSKKEIIDIDAHAAEIEELEKKLSDAKKTLKTLTGEDEKAQEKEAAAAQKKIDEVDKRIKDVHKKITNMQFESIADPLKKTADNEENALQQRLEALRQYYDEKLKLQDAQDAAETATVDDAISEAQTQKNIELLKKLEEEKNAILALNALERQKIETEYQEKINDMQEKEQKKQVGIIKNRIKEEQDALESSRQTEENALLKKYAEGLISREEYEQQKLDLQLEYSQQSLQIEIDTLKELLNIEGLTEKERLKIKDEIRNLELKNESEHLEAMEKLRNEDVKKQEQELEKLEQAKEKLRQQAWEAAESLLSAQFEKQIQKYDAEIDKINEHKEAEIAALEQSGKTEEEIEEGKMVIEARAEAQTKEIEKRKREAQTRQAKFEKAIAVTKATVEGARAAVAALPNLVLAGIIAATTALQVASILAQPIPQYAEGTKDHPGGAAIVGDARKRELIIEPSGRAWISKDKPTLIPDLPKHSVVLPSLDEIFSPSMKIFDNLHGVKGKALELSFDSAIEKQTKKLSSAIRESQSNMHVNLDSHGIFTISQKGEAFRKFTGNNLKHGR